MRRAKRIAGLVTALLLAPVILVGALLAFAQTGPGRSMIASLIEHFASAEDQRLAIGRLEGRIPFDVTIFDIAMADRNGDWLTIDRVRFAWRPFALLAGVLSIEAVEIGTVEIARLPEGGADGGGLPMLPFEIALERLEVVRLGLGEQVLGIPAAVAIAGEAQLGPPSEGLNLALSAERIDGTPGSLRAVVAYIPDSRRLGLDLTVEEPAGGLVSRLTGMAGLPSVRFTARGSGPIDDWRANLDLVAGDRGTASGTAAIARGGDGLLLVADLEADASGLVDLAYAPLAAGRSTLAARLRFADDGPVTIDRFEVKTAAAIISVRGEVVPATGALDIHYDAVMGEAGRYAVILPVQTSWAGIEAVGTVRGSLSEPHLALQLDGEMLEIASNRIAGLSLALGLAPTGPVTDRDRAIPLSLDLRAVGVAPAERAYGAAAGEAVRLVLDGSVTPAGKVTAEPARLIVGAGEIVWSGSLDAAGLDGRLDTRDFDLSVLAGLAGMDLAGRASLQAATRARFDGSALALDVSGGFEGLGTGIAALDGALGGSVTLNGGIRRDADGSFAFEDLRIAGAALSITANGSADERRADVVAAIALTDLARLDNRVDGAATIEARMTGSLADLDLDLQATIDEATAMGRPVETLRLAVAAQDVTGAPKGTVSLSGRLDGQPVSGRGRLSAADGAGGLAGLAIEGLEVVIGSVRVAGDIAFDPNANGTGRLEIKASDLSDLATLALTELRGSLDASLDLAVENGEQVVRARAEARGVRAFDLSLSSARLAAMLRDPTGRLAIDADLDARALDVGGNRIERITATARGGATANDITISATGLGARLDVAAGVALAGGDADIALRSLTLAASGQTATLAAPTTIRIAGGTISLARLTLRTGGGSLEIDGHAGATLDLSVIARALPLALADIAVAGSGIGGTLSGQARLTGTAAAPRGTYRADISRLVLPAMREAGFTGLDIAASGELLGEHTRVDARITGPGGAALTVTGTAPLSATGAVDLAARGRVDLAILNDMLAASGDRISGPVDVDMRITGRADAPDANGTIRLAGGTFVSPLNGVSFDQVALEARGGTRAVEITRFSARARNGGTVSGSGTVRLDAASGFPADLRITASNAEVVATDIVDAIVDASLSLTGPVASRPVLAGTVTIRQMDITLPDRLPRSAVAIPVRHVNTPEAVAAQLAAEAALQSRATGGPLIGLDLTVTTTNRIFVRGQGIDAQLGGEVTVRGTTAVPLVIGAFELRRGEVNFLTQRISLTRGRVTFSGGDRIDPSLDFLAETQTSSVTAQITVTGTASRPVFTLSSTPELPQDEILSRILFDKATGSLSAGEALQLAQAAGELTGVLSGSGGMIDSIRQNLGLDVLQLTTAGDTPAIGIGRYINDNIYVGVTQGVRPDSSRVNVDIDLTRNIRARGSVGADGSSSVGVNVEWEY
ncbi:autotransporter secretion inner membrane protein TamB [Tepidamorphus gemmatus]|uniref:Autotransporter secretion inner membrane protein TamB n=1 Tax=Tepidamorphus gemmatus TaxID=747076 RepID=A0A4R3MCU6_9HYPH|nr:translocation/assembly module TamB domain-containing protein [Tepidamorphus gemmatus]TCT09847.1 autotransporter secretion inner membrane protein TamB [Tepidamorphus gemmatus]